jgi:hypothetical protein
VTPRWGALIDQVPNPVDGDDVLQFEPPLFVETAAAARLSLLTDCRNPDIGAVTQPRMVNRFPASQLHERHDASHFDTKTQDKLAARVE